LHGLLKVNNCIRELCTAHNSRQENEMKK